MSYKLVDRILRDPSVAPGAKGIDRLVLAVFASYAKDNGTGAWPSWPTVAEACGVSVRTVGRSVQALKECGALVPTGSRKVAGKSIPVYRVTCQSDMSDCPSDDSLSVDPCQFVHSAMSSGQLPVSICPICHVKLTPNAIRESVISRFPESINESGSLYEDPGAGARETDYWDAPFPDGVPGPQSPGGLSIANDPDDPWDLPIDDDPPIVSIYQDGRLLGQTNRREAIDNARRLGYEIRP